MTQGSKEVMKIEAAPKYRFHERAWRKRDQTFINQSNQQFDLVLKMKVASMSSNLVAFVFLGICCFWGSVCGHGAMTDPPVRAYAWKVPSFSHLPKDYNYTEGNCGGAFVSNEVIYCFEGKKLTYVRLA